MLSVNGVFQLAGCAMSLRVFNTQGVFALGVLRYQPVKDLGSSLDSLDAWGLQAPPPSPSQENKPFNAAKVSPWSDRPRRGLGAV